MLAACCCCYSSSYTSCQYAACCETCVLYNPLAGRGDPFDAEPPHVSTKLGRLKVTELAGDLYTISAAALIEDVLGRERYGAFRRSWRDRGPSCSAGGSRWSFFLPSHPRCAHMAFCRSVCLSDVGWATSVAALVCGHYYPVAPRAGDNGLPPIALLPHKLACAHD
jgi:hypothetical protein